MSQLLGQERPQGRAGHSAPPVERDDATISRPAGGPAGRRDGRDEIRLFASCSRSTGRCASCASAWTPRSPRAWRRCPDFGRLQAIIPGIGPILAMVSSLADARESPLVRRRAAILEVVRILNTLHRTVVVNSWHTNLRSAATPVRCGLWIAGTVAVLRYQQNSFGQHEVGGLNIHGRSADAEPASERVTGRIPSPRAVEAHATSSDNAQDPPPGIQRSVQVHVRADALPPVLSSVSV